MNDLQYRCKQVGMNGKQTAQGNRKRQHPLAHRYLRDDMVHQMGRCLCHAPRAARGADAAAFAGESDKFLLGAAVAA